MVKNKVARFFMDHGVYLWCLTVFISPYVSAKVSWAATSRSRPRLESKTYRLGLGLIFKSRTHPCSSLLFQQNWAYRLFGPAIISLIQISAEHLFPSMWIFIRIGIYWVRSWYQWMLYGVEWSRAPATRRRDFRSLQAGCSSCLSLQ